MISDILNNCRRSIRLRGLRATLVTLAHVARWEFARGIARSDVLKRKIHDYEMYLSLREPGISETLNVFGFREPEHVHILRESVRAGMAVLDIGGNIGYYTIMLAKLVGSEGNVHAVEPIPANCELIRRNVALNKMDEIVTVEEMAVSDQSGTREIMLSKQSNLHGFHAKKGEEIKERLQLEDEALPVRTEELGYFLKSERLPEFIRMDVEGHEVEILTSLGRLAAENAWYPSVLCETHWEQYDPETHDPRPAFRQLFDLGYSVSWAATQREPAPEFKKRALEPVKMVFDGRKNLGLYREVTANEFLELVMAPDQVRCVLLERKGSPKER